MPFLILCVFFFIHIVMLVCCIVEFVFITYIVLSDNFIFFLLWVSGIFSMVCLLQDAMEKAIKAKVAKDVVPAIDVMFQALRFVLSLILWDVFIVLLYLICMFVWWRVWEKSCASKENIEDVAWAIWPSRSKRSRIFERTYSWTLSMDWKRPCKINIIWENEGYNGMLTSFMYDFTNGIFCCYLIFGSNDMYYYIFFLKKKELEAELVNVTGAARPCRKIRWKFIF